MKMNFKINRMKKLMLAILSVAFLASCQDKGYKINGTLEGAVAEKVILKDLVNGQPNTIDTAEVVDGVFTFTGAVDAPELFLAFVEGQREPIAFFVENTNITIKGKLEDIHNVEIEGSELNDKYKVFIEGVPGMDRLKELQKEFYQAQMAKDKDKIQVLNEEANSIMGEQRAYNMSFIKENMDNALGALMTLQVARSLSLDEFKPLVTEFQTNMPEHKYVKLMEEALETQEKAQLAEAATQVGAVAPEFTLPTKDGKDVSLSSFKGKYVLVDFWASWCGPCRNENPNVVAAYKKYNTKGFEVFSVSVDDDEKKWLEAVEADGLLWTNVRDVNKEVGKQYSIKSIPTTLLLDKEGKIIGKNLRGAELEEKLAELLD